MTDYDAGRAFISIVPSFDGVIERVNAQAARWGVTAGTSFSRGFNQTVRRETNLPIGPSQQQAARQGEQTGRTFADSFRARVDAALRSLPDIRIDADSSPAEVRIARLRTNLEQLRDQRIGVDIDTATALATVENLRRQIEELGRESPDVAVRIDTARATAELARIQAEIDALRSEDPEVDVHVDDHGSVANTEREVSKLAASLVALSPLAAPLGAALVAGLAGAAAVIGAIAAGVGVITLGLSGVGKTVELLDKRQQAATGQSGTGADQTAQAERALADARYNADQQAISSAEQVKRARQSLADTERRIARQAVADAARVADAQKSVLDAQQALHLAREQAKRDIEDAANAAIDANLSQQQAQIDLADAQEKLRQVNADWTASADDRRQAELDVAKAQQSLVEAGEKATRATQDNTKAQKDGVAGAPGFVSALQQQNDALQALHDARVKERQDAADGAREIARAEAAVTDALRQQQNQARSSAEAILNAQDAVAQAGTAGADSISSIDEQLAKTNPAVLAFAKFWHNQMSPIFDRLKAKAAEGLLPGLERGLKAMRPLFGPLGDFIGKLARTVGNLFAEMGKAFTSPFWTRFFAFLDRNMPRWLREFGHVIGNLATGLAGLFRAFGPIINMIGRGVVGLTARFAEWGKHLGRNSGFQSFLAYVRENGPRVVELFGHLFVIVGKLVQGLAPLGALLVKILNPLTSFLSKLSPTALLAITGAIAGLVIAFKAVAVEEWSVAAAADAIPWVALAVAAVAVAAIIVKHWSAISGFFVRLWRDVTGAFSAAWNWVKSTWSKLWNGAKQIVLAPVDAAKAALDATWSKLKAAFSGAWTWVRDTWSGLWDRAKAIVTAPIDAARDFLGDVWSKIKAVFSGAWSWLHDTFASLWNRATEIITAPIAAVETVFDRIWSGIKTAARDFVDVLKTIWGRLENIFKAPVRFVVNTVINTLIGAWDAIVGAVGLGSLKIDKIELPKGFAGGGIYPGYTPGRDIGYIGVSGGEAIMRPEWTRAVGPDYVHAANAAARTGGEPGVRQFLGGFASGGIAHALNPMTYINYIKDKIAGPIGALFENFGSSSWTRLVEHVPLSIASKMFGLIRDAVERLAAGALGKPLDITKYLPQIVDWARAFAYPPPGFDRDLVYGEITEMLQRLKSSQGLVPQNPIYVPAGTVNGVRVPAAEWGYIGPDERWHHAAAPSEQRDPASVMTRTYSRLGAFGWANPTQWNALHDLWMGESGWWWNALNEASGAYGIPQSLPANKMATAGADWLTNPDTQVRWGLGYIKGRYGSPAEAYSEWLGRNPHWYDEGGLLEPGLTLAYNGTGEAEVVAPRQTFEQIFKQPQMLRAVGELGITKDSLENLGAFVDARIRDSRFFDGAMDRVGG